MTASSDRSVGSLHLRVVDRADVRRGAALVEDAMRTASFAGADGGRMVIIRRLDLGRIARSAGAATVALQMERAYREASSRAVPFNAPGADRANAVFFGSRADSLLALVRGYVAGVRRTEWFWTTVLKEWRPDLGPEAFWPLVLDEAVRLPAGPIASAAIVEEVARADAVSQLLGVVRPDRARAYFSACGWRDLEEPIHVADIPLDPLTLADLQGYPELMQSHPRDVVKLWLLAMLSVAARPSRAGDPFLPQKIRRIIADARFELALQSSPHLGPLRNTTEVQMPIVRVEPLDSLSAGPTTTDRSAGHHSLPDAVHPAPEAGSVRTDEPHLFTAAQTEAPAFPDASGPSETRRAPEIDVPAWTGEHTLCGGLLFLLPVLDSLGMSEWMTSEPDLLEAGFGARLLRSMADGLGVSPEDPMLVVMESLVGEAASARGAPYPAGVQTLFSDAGRAVPEGPLAAWRAAVEIWLERNGRLDLRTVVARPSRVFESRTHISVFMSLSQLDVRIRRLGLDIDPGWVPWLGRVISFHYWRSDD